MSPPNEPGFRPMFNGHDLTGWDASLFWRSVDGVIVGNSDGPDTLPAPLKWNGNPLYDFELRGQYRLLDGADLKIRYDRSRGHSEFAHRHTDEEWHEFSLLCKSGQCELKIDGRPTGHAGSPREGDVAGRFSFEPSSEGGLELKDVRLRDISR